MNSALDYFEKIYEDKVHVELLGPDPIDEMKPKVLFNVQSATLTLPKGHPDFKLQRMNIITYGLPSF